MIISKIQEYCLLLYQTRHLAVYKKFHQKIMFFLKTFNSEFQEIKIWFTDQTSKPLEVDDRINVTLIIK